jgi:hypothetical protein
MNPNDFTKLGDRHRAILAHRQDAEVVVRFGVVGPKGDGTLQLAHRLVEPPLQIPINAMLKCATGLFGPRRAA